MGCESILKDPVLSKVEKLNVLGISQGGLVGRYVVQECLLRDREGVPGTHNLVTVGTPHMGQTTFYGCRTVTLIDFLFVWDLFNWTENVTCYLLNYITQKLNYDEWWKQNLPFISHISIFSMMRMPDSLAEYYQQS